MPSLDTGAAAQRPAAVRDTSQVKSLAKGLRALDLLNDASNLGTVELARALAIDKGAASRILRTLEVAGYATKDAARRYRPGIKLRQAKLPAAAPRPTMSIRERARPLLERLHELTGETAHLAIRADDQVLYLDRVDSEQEPHPERPVGTLSPLHCTALGKVFLAFGDAPLPRSLAAYTVQTPIDIGMLRGQLQHYRADGYTRDDEEFALGIRCVAAPLREPCSEEVVAAIGVSGPSSRISRARLTALGEIVRDTARSFGA